MNNGFTQNELRAIKTLLAGVEANTATNGGSNLNTIGGQTIPTEAGFTDAGTQLVNLPIDNAIRDRDFYFPDLLSRYTHLWYGTDFDSICRGDGADLLQALEVSNMNLSTGVSGSLFQTGLRWTQKTVAGTNASVDWWLKGYVPDKTSYVMVVRLRYASTGSFLSTDNDFYIGLKHFKEQDKTANVGSGVAAFRLDAGQRRISVDNTTVAQASWAVDTVDGSGLYASNKSKYDISAEDPNAVLRLAIEYNSKVKRFCFYVENNDTGEWILVHCAEMSNIKALRPFIHFASRQTTTADYNTTISELHIYTEKDPLEFAIPYSIGKSIADISVPAGEYAYPFIAIVGGLNQQTGYRYISPRKLSLTLDPLGSTSCRLELLYVPSFYDDLATAGSYGALLRTVYQGIVFDEGLTGMLASGDPTNADFLRTWLSSGADVIALPIEHDEFARFSTVDMNNDGQGSKARGCILLRVLNKHATDALVITDYALDWGSF